MKRTIEIDDTLPDRVDSAIEDVKAELLRYLEDNEPSELPDLGNDLDYSGAIHEIVDGAVPIYTHEIKVAWFLHGSDLESAYEDAGIGDNPMENDGMTAIYCYIDQAVREWYDGNAKTIFDEWKAQHDKEQAENEGKEEQEES